MVSSYPSPRITFGIGDGRNVEGVSGSRRNIVVSNNKNCQPSSGQRRRDVDGKRSAIRFRRTTAIGSPARKCHLKYLPTRLPAVATEARGWGEDEHRRTDQELVVRRVPVGRQPRIRRRIRGEVIIVIAIEVQVTLPCAQLLSRPTVRGTTHEVIHIPTVEFL